RARLEAPEPVRDAVLDARVVADVEMEVAERALGAPVAAVERVALGDVEGAGNHLAVLARDHEHEARAQALARQREEALVQVLLPPGELVDRAAVEREHAREERVGDAVADVGHDLDALGGELAALAAHLVAPLAAQAHEVVGEGREARVRPVVLPAGAGEPAGRGGGGARVLEDREPLPLEKGRAVTDQRVPRRARDVAHRFEEAEGLHTIDSTQPPSTSMPALEPVTSARLPASRRSIAPLSELAREPGSAVEEGQQRVGLRRGEREDRARDAEVPEARQPRLKSVPWSSISSAFHPPPTPKRTRPRERKSRLATSLAVVIGSRSTSRQIPEPTLRVVVTAAAVARATNGSCVCQYSFGSV